MDDLLTPADAARILGVVPATVRQLAITGRLPALRTASGMRLFQRQDVERLAHDRATHRGRLNRDQTSPAERLDSTEGGVQ
jgi:excisionase family DNA binding protein